MGAPGHRTTILARNITATFNNSVQLLCVAVAASAKLQAWPVSHLCALDQGLLAFPIHPLGGFLRAGSGAVDDSVDADQRGRQRGRVPQVCLYRRGPPVAEEVCRVLPRPHDASHLRTQ